MMLLITHRFLSWFRSKKNTIILVYGLASTMIAIELALTLPISSALFETVGRTVGGAGLLSESPVFPSPPYVLLCNRLIRFMLFFQLHLS